MDFDSFKLNFNISIFIRASFGYLPVTVSTSRPSQSCVSYKWHPSFYHYK